MIKQNPHTFPINVRKSKMHEKMWEDPSEVAIWGSGTHLERSWRSAGSTVRWDAGRWQVVSCYSEGATTNQTFQACHFAKSELPGLWKDRGFGAVSSQEGQARKGGLNFELRCQELNASNKPFCPYAASWYWAEVLLLWCHSPFNKWDLEVGDGLQPQLNSQKRHQTISPDNSASNPHSDHSDYSGWIWWARKCRTQIVLGAATLRIAQQKMHENFHEVSELVNPTQAKSEEHVQLRWKYWPFDCKILLNASSS